MMVSPSSALRCVPAFTQARWSGYAGEARAGSRCNRVRIAAAGSAGDVLVSVTTRDLVAGSGLVFADRGEVELKGIGARRLYAATV